MMLVNAGHASNMFNLLDLSVGHKGFGWMGSLTWLLDGKYKYHHSEAHSQDRKCLDFMVVVNHKSEDY